MPLNRPFCCVSGNAFWKRIFGLYPLIRPLHIFFSFFSLNYILFSCDFFKSIDHDWAIHLLYLLLIFLEGNVSIKALIFFPEQLLVLIEYVPFGDLLGYLRKSRGLNDTYYKDPDIKPQTNLTSQQLMKFAWQIADGMSYLSSKSVS